MNKIKKILLALFGVTLAAAAGNEALPSDVAMGKVSKAYDVSEPLKAKYDLENSQFAIKGKEDKNATRTVIGEAGSAEFSPTLEISKWNGEASFKIKPDVSKVAKKNKKLESAGERIKYKAGKQDYVFYDKPDASEEGGFEFEIVLNEKPASNVFVTPIETQGLEFYPQPPLNEEPQDDGVTCTATECKDTDGRVTASRPEDIVDSIAVYSNGKVGDYTAMGGYNYMAGKIAHIKRIKMVAANGASEYCKQAINTVWTITCPQDFLDKAVYPVVVDPTFGYTTQGGSQLGGGPSSDGNVYFNPEVSVVYGDISKVSIYGKRSGDCSVRGVVAETNGDIVSDLTVSSQSMPTSNAWVNMNTTGTLDGKYYLVGWNLSSGNGYWNYDAGTSQYLSLDSNSVPTTSDLPSNIQIGSNQYSKYKFSLYATYTAGLDTNIEDSVLSDGFESNNWTTTVVTDTGTDPVWTRETSGSNPTIASPLAGSYMAKFNSNSATAGGVARFSRNSDIDLSIYQDAYLEFYLFRYYSNSTTEGVNVVISIDGGTNWTTIQPMMYESYYVNDGWARGVVGLKQFCGEASVKIGLLGTGQKKYNCFIDSINVYATYTAEGGETTRRILITE